MECSSLLEINAVIDSISLTFNPDSDSDSVDTGTNTKAIRGRQGKEADSS